MGSEVFPLLLLFIKDFGLQPFWITFCFCFQWFWNQHTILSFLVPPAKFVQQNFLRLFTVPILETLKLTCTRTGKKSFKSTLRFIFSIHFRLSSLLFFSNKGHIHDTLLPNHNWNFGSESISSKVLKGSACKYGLYFLGWSCLVPVCPTWPNWKTQAGRHSPQSHRCWPPQLSPPPSSRRWGRLGQRRPAQKEHRQLHFLMFGGRC